MSSFTNTSEYGTFGVLGTYSKNNFICSEAQCFHYFLIVFTYLSQVMLQITNTAGSSDSNVIRTHNHLVRKRTLNHLAKFV